MYIEFTTKQLKTGTISAECEEEDLFEEAVKAMTFLAFKILMKMDQSLIWSKSSFLKSLPSFWTLLLRSILKAGLFIRTCLAILPECDIIQI